MACQIAYLRKRAYGGPVQIQQGLFDTVDTTLYNSGHWGNKTHTVLPKTLLWSVPNCDPRIPGSFLDQKPRGVCRRRYFI